MTERELEQLREAARGAPHAIIEIVTTKCAYSCCGRPWQHREGYEQTYRGWIDNFEEDPPRFMLYAVGIGTISYVVAVHASRVVAVEAVRG